MPSPADLQHEGLQHFQADRLAEAAGCFAEAARLFAAQGDRASAAEMKNNLCVVRLAQEEWDAALAAVGGTPEIFRERGDRLREAQAFANLARAHEGANHPDQAAELYEQAIDLLAELGEKETRAACWKALSGIQLKQGKQLQAMASMQAGLNLVPSLSPKEKTLKALLDKAMQMMGR
ncbi:MAG: tetratricopeptide repeat protein [Anaerolineales bacterium]